MSAAPYTLPEPGKAWRLELAGDQGIGVLLLDLPDEKLNILNLACRASLGGNP